MTRASPAGPRLDYSADAGLVPDSPAALCTITRMSETTLSLDQQLEEIGAQLAWVRDYL